MKQKSPDELKASIRFYRTITAILAIILLFLILKSESERAMLTEQLTAQVKAHEALTLKYDTLNYDVVSGSCLLRSQL
jgi:hypothetical protein